MPEVREQAAHIATFGVQRGKILERNFLLRLCIPFRGLRLHAAFLRVSLATMVSIGLAVSSRCVQTFCVHSFLKAELRGVEPWMPARLFRNW